LGDRTRIVDQVGAVMARRKWRGGRGCFALPVGGTGLCGRADHADGPAPLLLSLERMKRAIRGFT